MAGSSRLVDVGSSVVSSRAQNSGNSGHGKSGKSGHASECSDSSPADAIGTSAAPSDFVGTVIPSSSGKHGRSVSLLQASTSTSGRLSHTT